MCRHRCKGIGTGARVKSIGARVKSTVARVSEASIAGWYFWVDAYFWVDSFRASMDESGVYLLCISHV